MILYELKELALLLPQAALGLPPAPPPVPGDFRGIAIHWWTYALPTQMPEVRMAPRVPIRTWQWFGVDFSTVSKTHADTPPETTIERDYYINRAVTVVLARYEIPEPRTLAWEVRLGAVLSAPIAFTFTVRSQVIGVKWEGNDWSNAARIQVLMR